MTTIAPENDDSFIKTATHNFVSRRAKIEGAQNVELRGKTVLHPGVEVRGDLARVKAGRYCSIGSNTVLKPPLLYNEKHVPLTIGSHTRIRNNCTIFAAAVGSNVLIGDSVKLGERCIVRDNCIIEEGSHLGDDTVVPPFSRVAGKPAKVVDQLPESVAVILPEDAIEEFKDFCNSNPPV